VAFQKLGHQLFIAPLAALIELQYVGAITFFGESATRAFHLPLNALGS